MNERGRAGQGGVVVVVVDRIIVMLCPRNVIYMALAASVLHQFSYFVSEECRFCHFLVCRIFLAFSNFMEMHGLMANYRIGMLTMKVMFLRNVHL